LHLIDGWWELYGACFPDWGAYTEHGRLTTGQAYLETQAVVRQYGRDSRVETHVGHDLDVLAGFPDGFFDWVYLDSSHDYDGTRRELALLTVKVRPGGLILGDDWHDDPAHVHAGGTRAIRELCAHRAWRVTARDGFGQWAISQDSPPTLV
jgi:predicted O-methyltransferase YrrM